MKLKLFPKDSFDKGSIESMNKLIGIAEKLLTENNVEVPSYFEFYDSLDLFIERILFQVKNYGLSENQSREFVKASLNSGTYGTFDIDKGSIIEMNFNPYFKTFYPAIHFLKLLIHESLHLFLYSKLKRDIYSDKFKFYEGRYVGKKKIILLDEGFAEFFTEKILENYDLNSIKDLPIYSELNEVPSYKKFVEGLNLEGFNEVFDKVYEENSNKGYNLIKSKSEEFEGDIEKTIIFISEEIEKLFEHE